MAKGVLQQQTWEMSILSLRDSHKAADLGKGLYLTWVWLFNTYLSIKIWARLTEKYEVQTESYDVRFILIYVIHLLDEWCFRYFKQIWLIKPPNSTVSYKSNYVSELIGEE